jgi:serine protease inhibitor
MKLLVTAAAHSYRLVALIAMLFLTPAISAAPVAEDHLVASANTGFAFKLLKQLAKDQPGNNIFISPFGVSTVLQMAGNGAAGQTKAEMQQVLGTTSLIQAVVNTGSRDINQYLNTSDTNNILTIANAIWYQKGIPAKPDFLSCNQQFFGATVAPLDFTNVNAHPVDVINSWASEKTHGKITHIADGMMSPPPDLFLANAVYFKGKWEDPFDRGSTKDRAFHLRNGGQKQVPMMEKSRKFTYRRGSGYQAVRLPYEGWNLSMYVFLPDPGSGPEKLVGIMTGDKWERVTRPGFEDRDGTVVLPKFKLEYSVGLEKPLKALGMNVAFNPFGAADFSGISSRSLYISAVQQLTFVEVNEEGTEAAAVTGMAVPMSSGPEPPPPPPFKMIVDRPFLFLIADEPTGTILFMGLIFEPKL